MPMLRHPHQRRCCPTTRGIQGRLTRSGELRSQWFLCRSREVASSLTTGEEGGNVRQERHGCVGGRRGDDHRAHRLARFAHRAHRLNSRKDPCLKVQAERGNESQIRRFVGGGSPGLLRSTRVPQRRWTKSRSRSGSRHTSSRDAEKARRGSERSIGTVERGLDLALQETFPHSGTQAACLLCGRPVGYPPRLGGIPSWCQM